MSKVVKKAVVAKAKLQLPAGKATPAPPVGPAISPLGINIKQFCDEFNNRTRDKEGYRIPVEVHVYKDKTFELFLKQPPVSNLIAKMISLPKGASNSKTEVAGTLTKKHIDEIIKIKLPDMNTVCVESAAKMIRGTARSMGVKVEE